MVVTKHLFAKSKRGNPADPALAFGVGPNGINEKAYRLPLRQVLIAPTQSLAEFNSKPRNLRENIAVDGIDLHKLESGTAIQMPLA